jgi:hypothetical protein
MAEGLPYRLKKPFHLHGPRALQEDHVSRPQQTRQPGGGLLDRLE